MPKEAITHESPAYFRRPQVGNHYSCRKIWVLITLTYPPSIHWSFYFFLSQATSCSRGEAEVCSWPDAGSKRNGSNSKRQSRLYFLLFWTFANAWYRLHDNRMSTHVFSEMPLSTVKPSTTRSLDSKVFFAYFKSCLLSITHQYIQQKLILNRGNCFTVTVYINIHSNSLYLQRHAGCAMLWTFSLNGVEVWRRKESHQSTSINFDDSTFIKQVLSNNDVIF